MLLPKKTAVLYSTTKLRGYFLPFLQSECVAERKRVAGAICPKTCMSSHRKTFSESFSNGAMVSSDRVKRVKLDYLRFLGQIPLKTGPELFESDHRHQT